MSSKNSQLSALIETALVAAFAMALSYIPDFASWFTPSFGAVPVVLFALRRGPKYGTLAGLIWGLLHFILGKVLVPSLVTSYHRIHHYLYLNGFGWIFICPISKCSF